MISSNIIVPIPDKLYWNAEELSAMIGISKRKLLQMDSAGQIPQSERWGTRALWRVSEVKSWLDEGRPDRHIWEQVKRQKKQNYS